MDILLVDDDKVDRELIKRILKKCNLAFQITEAVSVNQGLKLYFEHHFDIVLLDCRMPERDGIEMILELRSSPKMSETAIIMMSTSEDEHLALDCIRAGAQDFLTKAEITDTRLRRAVLHATTRFELETQLQATYNKIKKIAESDALTGLANRYLFDESLKHAIANNRRNEYKLAIILFDLDHFKNVNDSYGHDIGDLLLQRVVRRVKSCLRGNEVFARLGGDEFSITLSNLECVESAGLVARRILRVLEKPVEIAGAIIKISTSIGIAIHPDSGSNSEELFKCADIAMYRAKKMGRNRLSFFERKMQESFQSRLTIENELRGAILNNQLQLFYQPVINLKTKLLVGFESLIRWNINGLIRMPDQFVSIAEETFQIKSIGDWVIDKSISTLSKWNSTRDIPWTVAINVSAMQLQDTTLVDYIRSVIKKYSVPPHLIDIEVTETVLLKDTEVSRNIISGLHDLGVRLSLDDFGVGFSSIAHLHNYPIDVLKIDKVLIGECLNNKTKSLVQGLVYMADVLGIDVIAEGVENEFSEKVCQDMNIKSVQGFYYSKPLSESEVEDVYSSI